MSLLRLKEFGLLRLKEEERKKEKEKEKRKGCQDADFEAVCQWAFAKTLAYNLNHERTFLQFILNNQYSNPFAVHIVNAKRLPERDPLCLTNGSQEK